MTTLGWTVPRATPTMLGKRHALRLGLSHLVVRDAEGAVRTRCGTPADLSQWFTDPPVTELRDVCQRCAAPFAQKKRRPRRAKEDA